MRLATKADLPRATKIIAKSFSTNPSILWVIKKDRKQDARTRALAKYSFNWARIRQGAYLASNERGVALCYRAKQKSNLLLNILYQAELVIKAIGIFRIGIVLKRQAYLKSHMPKDTDYLYFWFYGVEPGYNGQGDAKEIKDEIFRMADEAGLPIILETSVEKNRRVYERYGFRIYHEWHNEDQQLRLYFMQREPRSG